MPKIIGESIEDYVKDQIKVRQAAHGSGTDGTSRSLNQITYLNSKTAWVKLASGVQIKEERILTENIRSGFEWQSLAQHHILFGGISEKDDTILKQRGSFGSGNDNIWGKYAGAYNVNASNKPDSEFGLVPMPGITSVDIKCLTRGSIKKATINLKCYSPEQFQIIDLLYLRIGYTMFLEWGNSLYLNEDSELQKMYYTLTEHPSVGFYSENWKQSSYLGFLPIIEKHRKIFKGNYDGLLCKVTNFSWTFSQDGSYDITLDLMSLGDVVESLRLNIAPSYDIAKFINDAYSLYKDDADQETSVSPSPADNWITAYLFLQKLAVDSENSTTGYGASDRYSKRDAIAGKIGDGTVLELGGVFVTLPPTLEIEVDDPLSLTTKILAYTAGGAATGVAVTIYDYFFGTKTETIETPEVVKEKKDIVHFAYNRGETDEDQDIVDSEFYMRFGHLLQFLSDFVIPSVKDTDVPMLLLDYDQWSNRMYTLPYQVSLDPRVCIVNAANEKINTKEFFPNLTNWKYISADQTESYGWIMNIYINHAQILSSLEDAKNDKGEVNLFDFLSSLCTAINKAMGGINNLEPIYDEDNHMINIIDGSYAPQSDPGYLLELYGYNKTSSTFVRNFNLKTEITNDFATMASIGSTAGGYTKGVENTMFSKWNKGLIDPWKEKYVPPKKARDLGSDEKEPNILYVEEFWKQRYSAWGYTLKDVSDDLLTSDKASVDDSLIERNLTTVAEFYKYCQSKIQIEEERYASPTNGFVPISLGLTMDGISGIKIYNEINVDTRFLPQNYNNSLRFIVKGVNHKLSNSDWETNIETVVISQSGDKNRNPLPYYKIRQIIDKEINDAAEALGSSSDGASLTPPLINVAGGVSGLIGTIIGSFIAGGTSSCESLPPAKGMSKSANKIIKASTTNDNTIVQAIVDYLEGGYYHPTHAYNPTTKQIKSSFSIYKNSGETLYGLDRYAGNNEGFRSGPKNPSGIDFWSAVDAISGYGSYKDTNRTTKTGNWDIGKYPKKGTGWSWNYMPKKSDPGYNTLQKNLTKYITDSYTKLFTKYLAGHPVGKLVENDGRLKFMYYRATWNGSGFFQKYANNLKKVYDGGEKNVDKLICADLTYRYNTKSAAFKPGVSKMSYMMDYNP